MSKVKIELPETETKDEYQIESQGGEPKDVQDLTGFVQTLLQQMQDKFQEMSDQIINRRLVIPVQKWHESVKHDFPTVRVDEMGARIDDLEKNIGELMTQAGVDEPEK